jgi:hypothetical protein
MTLKATSDLLWQRAHRLRDDATALRLAAVEDVPAGEQVKLIDDVGAAAAALAGWVEETVTSAAAVVEGARHPDDTARVRQALIDCGEHLEHVAEQFADQLSGTNRTDELTALARRGGREHHAWVATIRHAVDRAQSSAWAVQFALTACWRELAERATAGDGPPARAGTERRS